MSIIKQIITLAIVLIVVAFPNVNTQEGQTCGYGPGKQDCGYVEVRPGAHIFWWLYHTTSPDVQVSTERPLAIWLQGGPGSSSTGYGNFEEFGPLDLKSNPRDFTWVKDMNVLFIDSPVGTGFSYVENDDTSLLTRTNAEIASDLVIALKGFYDELPEFLTVPLHIFSESYGGKVAVEFAYVLYQAIQNETIQCDLKSVTSVDGWISPLDSIHSWAPLLLAGGVVDEDGANLIINAENIVLEEYNAGRYASATNRWWGMQSAIFAAANNIDIYNFINPQKYAGRRDFQSTCSDCKNPMHKLLIDNVRQTEEPEYTLDEFMRNVVTPNLTIPSHVTFGNQSGLVFNTLNDDFMKDDIAMVENLLNYTNVEVHIITGQLDIIVATPGTVEWMKRVQWPGAQQYRASRRTPIVVRDIIEGYEKRFENLSMYWINRAGHMVPFDNPPAMDYILRLVTKYDQLT